MKILHTSDWHLGQLLYDYDRTAEQTDMLSQIEQIVKEEHPDAMLVSGDIFHTGNPSSAAIEIYAKAMLNIHSACPQMRIIVIAGNHDSAARLTSYNALWCHFSVDIIGTVARNRDECRTPDFDRHIIEVCDPSGKGIGIVAAVPHCYESNYPSQSAELQREQRLKAYYHGLAERIREINSRNLPTVLMAHLAVTGCDLAGHESVGGMETKDASALGEGYDYIALGHIHTPQTIGKRVRYSGSPIPVNFGEKYAHSVSIVTVETGKEPVVETRVIRNLIPLEDFPTKLPMPGLAEEELKEADRPLPIKEVIDRLHGIQADEVKYLRIVVKVDETLSPLANAQITEALKGKKARFCRIQTYTYPRKDATAEAVRRIRLTGQSLKDKTPTEIAEMFFALKNMEFTPSQKEMIKEAEEIARQNKG